MLSHRLMLDSWIWTAEDEDVEMFGLNPEESKALHKFLLTIGYINYESDIKIHEIFKRLDEYVKAIEETNKKERS